KKATIAAGSTFAMPKANVVLLAKWVSASAIAKPPTATPTTPATGIKPPAGSAPTTTPPIGTKPPPAAAPTAPATGIKPPAGSAPTTTHPSGAPSNVHAPAPTSFTVTFDGQRADTPANPRTKVVTPPATNVGALPTPPAKASNKFGGWYTAIKGGTPFTAATPVAANITVYARWTPAYSYMVTFDSQFATTQANPPRKTVISPATTVGTLPTAPTKTGCIFGGWFTMPNGGGSAFKAATVANASITVYAKWTPSSTPAATDDDSASIHLRNIKSGDSRYPIAPQFNGDVLQYTLELKYSHATTPLFVERVNSSTSKVYIKFNDAAEYRLFSEYGSETLNLNVGMNTARLRVVANDHDAARIYVVKITRAPADTNALLSSIVPVSGIMTPAFSPSVTRYTIVAPEGATTINVRIAAQVATSSFECVYTNGYYAGPFVANGSGPASALRSLNISDFDETLYITVQAQDPAVRNSYEVVVKRTPGTNAHLPLIQGHELNPAFSRDITEYAAVLENWDDDITFIFSPEDEKHYLVQYSTSADPVFRRPPYLINAPGIYRIDVPVSSGETVTIYIKVIAEDRITEMIYQIAVTRKQ
ncbi:MAG: cadherin-like beta sandwich domain-containing protein, partial [Spirochaetes bacterium]|nr:cadherin-like beta sandwich domain-containing protein [Spirochaetota bacterium]